MTPDISLDPQRARQRLQWARDALNDATATLERAVAGPRYYVLLMPDSEGPARYQLLLATRRW